MPTLCTNKMDPNLGSAMYVDMTRSQDKTAKKIDFDTFVKAVALIAEKMGKTSDELAATIVSAKGPR